jgi:hypothetical protein
MHRVPSRFLIGLTVAFCSAGVAWAHPAPFSYLDVVFKDGGIEGTLVVHVIDVAHELGVPPERVMDESFGASPERRIGEKQAPPQYLHGQRRFS